MKTYRIAARVTAIVFLWAVASGAYALSCQEVRTLTGVYTRMHYAYSNFDNELSERTLENFIKALDPGKTYFFETDVAEFRNKYAAKLDDLLLGGNCSAIDEIMNVYGKRFAESQTLIQKKLIDANHDFTVDEYMDVDIKQLSYPKDAKEAEERWRKRIKFAILQMKSGVPEMEKIRAKMHKRYELAEKRNKEMTSSEILSIFLNAFAGALDPHSDYMSAERLEDFRIQTRLSLEGIGAVLRPEDGFTVIQSLVPGGAAAKTGLLKVNDKIIEVAQGMDGKPVDVIDMELQEVVKLIRGARDTTVVLTILRDDGSKTTQLKVPVTRKQIQLTDKQAKSEVIPVEVQGAKGKSAYKIGLIRLPSFYIDFEGRQQKVQNFRSSSVDMKNQIDQLKSKGVDAMIVDLRNNGGGSLDESVAVAGLFLKKGPMVQIKTRDAKILSQDDTDPQVAYDGPLMVLVNRQSASASEIFAGAIQDYGRGLIIGDSHTFGKGTVQNVQDISEQLGAVKVTISKFYRPLGASTQLKGVESDIVLPDIFDEYEFGEKFYDYAMRWDKISPTTIEKLDRASPVVTKLKIASEERIGKDALFLEIQNKVKEFRKNEAERKRVSLKEKVEDKKVAAATTPTPKPQSNDDSENEMSEDGTLPLEKDAHLQETLRVAGDYLQITNKKDLGVVTIPGVKVEAAVAVATAKPGLPSKPAEEKKTVSKEAEPAKPSL